MLTTDYKFAIEILTPEGAPLGQFPVTVDWEPARENARLVALRRGSAGAQAGANTVVEPVWEETAGEPHAAGARMIEAGIASDIPLNYFKPLAVEISTGLVEKEILKAGDRYGFKLLAFRGPEPAPEPNAFSVEDVIAPLHVKEARLADLECEAAPFGRVNGEDFPVFLPQGVLDEAKALTLEAGEFETGGILIGHLYRDPSLLEIAVVVTAQIPALHTHSKSTELTFTAQTWTAVRAALDLRRAGEMFMGWWHSHPAFSWCQPECAPERRKSCPLQRAFLSADDLLLHRTVFCKAFHVALLANHATAGLEFALFGWRRGTVQHRGFQITGGSRAAMEDNSSRSDKDPIGGNEDATLCKK